MVELLSRLFVKFRRREPLSAAELTRILSCLSLLGMTPADRSRIVVQDSTPNRPFAEFASARRDGLCFNPGPYRLCL